MAVYSQSLAREELEQRTFITQVYLWMGLALGLTGLVAMHVASSESLANLIVGSPLFFVLIIGELLLVIALSAWINKMSAATAYVMFFVYAAINGMTLSVVFMAYTSVSIASTFFITAGTFGLMSAYGYITKKDLSSWGNMLFMGLIGIILASVVNIFLKSPAVYWITTYMGILVFVGLTAYDTQKIKRMASFYGNEDSEESRKVAVLGALQLYLDFINLFLLLLRVLGRRK